uniref:hypothetical protein n=1 Tax=Aeromonas salmonicida TaxID=645 RepID=UPI00359C2527
MGKALTPSPIGLNNRSLINRGSPFWVDAEAMDNWFHQDHHGNGDAVSSTPTRASVPF